MKRFLGGKNKGDVSSSQPPPPPEQSQPKPVEESLSETEFEEELSTLKEERFVNNQAQEVCKEDHKRLFIQERGIRLKDFGSEETVKGYNWDDFVADRTAVGALVRQFYVNANECDGTTSWVRCFTVHYSEATINKYFKLDVRQNAAYNQCLTATTPAMILEVLRANEAVDWAWTIGAGRKPKFLKEGGMNRDAKAHNRFLAASLMPSEHTFETIYEKYRVMYAIMVGATP